MWSLTLDEGRFQATDWGWMQRDGKLIPISTDVDVAPEALQNVICCKCNPANGNPCGTRSCTCRKYGLPCFSSCSGCRGKDCNNCDVSIMYYAVFRKFN